MAKNTKPIYRVTVQVLVEVDVRVTANSAAEAIALAAVFNPGDLIKPADGSCEFVNWELPGVINVAMDGFVPFKK